MPRLFLTLIIAVTLLTLPTPSYANTQHRAVFTAPSQTVLVELQNDLVRKGWRIVDVIEPLSKIVADAPAGPRTPASRPAMSGVKMNADTQVHLIAPRTPRRNFGEPLTPHLRIRDQALWSQGFTGAGVKVAIIDTGVADIPQLSGRLEQPDGSAFDLNGHGTHVAGIVAAAQGEGMTGVAPQATILSYSALESDGSGSGAKVSAAIVAAVQQGAQVINLSLGGPERDLSIGDAIAWADAQGTAVVCASGNSGLRETFWPAAEPGCLGVGAIDGYGRRAIFSTSGSHVDLTAPGQDIASFDASGAAMAMSGTSMATPHVSGALALLIQTGMTPHAAKAALLAGARDVGSLGFDVWTGHGIVDVQASVDGQRQRPLFAGRPQLIGRVLAGVRPMAHCGHSFYKPCIIKGRRGKPVRTRLSLSLLGAPWQQDKFVIRVDRKIGTKWRLYADGDLAIAAPGALQPSAAGLVSYWHSGLYRIRIYSQGMASFPRTAVKTVWIKRA